MAQCNNDIEQRKRSERRVYSGPVRNVGDSLRGPRYRTIRAGTKVGGAGVASCAFTIPAAKTLTAAAAIVEGSEAAAATGYIANAIASSNWFAASTLSSTSTALTTGSTFLITGGTVLVVAGIGMAVIGAAAYCTADKIDDGAIDRLILSNELLDPGYQQRQGQDRQPQDAAAAQNAPAVAQNAPAAAARIAPADQPGPGVEAAPADEPAPGGNQVAAA